MVRSYSIRFPSAVADEVATILWELQSLGSSELAAAPGEASWAVFFDDSVAAAEVEMALRGRLLAPLGLHEVDRRDWVEEFRKHYRALSVGSFRILPIWDEEEPRHARTLVMDPGRAFGTGTHESTRLCILALEGLAAAPRGLGRVADIGTGTGILGIAALRLGAAFTVGAEIDPEALRVAARHAGLNGAALPFVRADCARAFRPASFDTVVANIAAPLLTARAAELEAIVKPEGRLLLCGLLTEEADRVAAVYQSSRVEGRLSEGEWSCLILSRTS